MSTASANSAEIGFYLRIRERKISLQNRKNAVGAKLLISFRLRHRIVCGGGHDARHDGHAPLRSLDRCAHDRRPLLAVQIGKLPGRAERRQAMHAGLDEVVAEPAEHARAHLAVGIDGRDEIGKDAVEIRHGRKRP